MTAEASTFSGFISLKDPIKADLADNIAELKKLGIALKMITGDNHLIASNIANEIDLKTKEILLGQEIDSYSPSQLVQRISDVDVFAEVSPNQKEKIIRAFKSSGEVVGYMGDGINDAPSIKAADVGISVNTAADTAKDAASIVLLEQDLRVLIDGVLEGRRIFANTLKYIFIATSANFGNMFSMAGASLFLPFLPLLPQQILSMNLLTDFPALQMSTDSVEKEWILQPMTWNMQFIQRFMIVFGLVSTIFDYLTFYVLLAIFHSNELAFQSGWFLESIFSATIVMLIVRSNRSIFQSRPSKALAMAVGIILLVVLFIIYTPVGHLIGLQPVPLEQLALFLLLVFLYALTAELVKHYFYHSQSFMKGKRS
nr:HAD-IC family P-type ATPase [Streptococcus catagoni]